MTRRYDDPVDVRRQADEPAEFLWRGRLYVVRGVLAHWVETGAWWRSAAAGAVTGAADPTDDTVPSSVALVEDERELWRVEASAGRLRDTGVFDLCLDLTAGAWTLARALD
jgi:hypothetical protein